MKGIRSMPAQNAHVLEQLFQTRPALRRALQQLQRPGPSQQVSSFRTGTRARQQISQQQQRALTTRSYIHSQRHSTKTLRSQKRPLSSTNPIWQAFRRRTGTGRRTYSSNTTGAGTEEKLSLSQRLKKLSREYGWSALGVYLLLTALDFPFCFLAVRLLGTDRIGHWEHVAVSYIKGVLKWPVSNQQAEEEIKSATEELQRAEKVGVEQGASKRILEEESREVSKEEDEDGVSDHGYKEAEKANSGANASIWTQLALAYAIHKSFIFVRVPLTAAITPKVVKTLRSWGWNIGKVPKTAGSSSSSSSVAASQSSKTGVNTKGSGVKPDD
ncbi:hypothetical protein A1O1_08098 [Capronia coronata CBS 617.96]|uniref:DUF1279 domain-containing protein n=1 Tax=Capronia coronata CBS 617.96 TaxID=1182541 RepID=W9XXE0_9EURO|nr:uncharacterized protein A1O1_08098 [Capronia coronata CBS 617.96]EXJ82030.1 hypothetical protein A1O1_08098 [Capronia coronata CBS 617.96]